jgi:hypothetical protein
MFISGMTERNVSGSEYLNLLVTMCHKGDLGMTVGVYHRNSFFSILRNNREVKIKIPIPIKIPNKVAANYGLFNVFPFRLHVVGL